MEKEATLEKKTMGNKMAGASILKRRLTLVESTNCRQCANMNFLAYFEACLEGVLQGSVKASPQHVILIFLCFAVYFFEPAEQL